MIQRIRFQQTCLNGLNPMHAVIARSFPRHTHDQYGIGVVDHGAQASVSDSRQVEAGLGNLVFVNHTEVDDGHAIGAGPRARRMLYFTPRLLQEAQEDVPTSARRPCPFSAPTQTQRTPADATMRLHTTCTRKSANICL